MVIFIHSMVYETWGCCLGKLGGVTLAWRLKAATNPSSFAHRVSRGGAAPDMAPSSPKNPQYKQKVTRSLLHSLLLVAPGMARSYTRPQPNELSKRRTDDNQFVKFFSESINEGSLYRLRDNGVEPS